MQKGNDRKDRRKHEEDLFMKALAIDTSGKNLTVAVISGDKTTLFCDAECGVNHSVDLMPKIEETLKKAQVELKDLDFIACAVGAGSFTGIRIGISTAKALCFASAIPCLAVTSFETIAYNIKGKKTLAIINAKHDSFYVCGFSEDKKVVLEPKFISLEELKALKKEYTFISGEKIDGVKTKVVSVAEGLILAVKENQDKVSDDLESLAPLYIRKSQAEEGR